MSSNAQPVAALKPPAPPEEQFWIRYSPHHEFSLSTTTSFALHALGIGLITLVAWYVNSLMSKQDKPVPVDAIIIPGGGGNTLGVGENPGGGSLDQPPEAVTPTNPPASPPVTSTTPPDLKAPEEPTRPDLSVPDSSDALARAIEQGKIAVGQLKKMDADTIKGIEKSFAAGKGKGGKGSGGGKGTGVGTGTGPGIGAGDAGKLSQRQKRMGRWTIIFDTRSGEDYARQLQGAGAFLAVPDPENPAQYRVFHNLKDRPVQGNIEDLSKVDLIWWYTDNPRSNYDLALALGIKPVPPRFIAFFPREFEDRLSEVEHAYRGRKENELRETQFRLIERDGKLEPVVLSQR